MRVRRQLLRCYFLRFLQYIFIKTLPLYIWIICKAGFILLNPVRINAAVYLPIVSVARLDSNFPPWLRTLRLTRFISSACRSTSLSSVKKSPEGTGVIAGTVFLVCVVILQLFFGRHSVDKVGDPTQLLL